MIHILVLCTGFLVLVYSDEEIRNVMALNVTYIDVRDCNIYITLL